MSRGIEWRDLLILAFIFIVCVGGGILISSIYIKRFWWRRFLSYLWKRFLREAESGSFRRDLEIPILLIRQESGQAPERTRTIDVSRGGMFVKTNQPYPIRSTFPFRLQLSDKESIEGVGLVRWTQNQASSSHPAGMGVEFLDLSEREKTRIRAFVQRNRQSKKKKIDARGSR